MVNRKVFWHPAAKKSLCIIIKFIALDKPETSKKFGNDMVLFADNLGKFSSYAPCRHLEFSKQGLCCINYLNNYIIIYRVTSTKVYIVAVVHASRLK